MLPPDLKTLVCFFSPHPLNVKERLGEGDCFKFLWPFQNVQTLLEKRKSIQLDHNICEMMCIKSGVKSLYIPNCHDQKKAYIEAENW